MLQNNSELKSKIDHLWNKFWSCGIFNPLTVIEQYIDFICVYKVNCACVREGALGYLRTSVSTYCLCL